MRNDAPVNSRAAAGSSAAEQLTDLDVEMALMTLSTQDMGEPTEDMDLSVLTPNEKRVLLDLLRKRLGNVPTAGAHHPADTAASTVSPVKGKASE
ncbi:MAG: hypothetical protein V4671_08250 [Armatimonadota bacterium]